MTEELISFETAKLAKEKGFNIRIQHTVNGQNCLYFLDTGEVPKMINTNQIDNWNDDKKFQHVCSAPTQSLLQKWLREIHKIHIEIDFYDNARTYHFEYRVITSKNRDYNDLDMIDSAKRHYNAKKFNTYEKALEQGLYQALKLIK